MKEQDKYYSNENKIVDIACAYWQSAVLFAACQLDLFTEIKKVQPVKADDLALRLKLSPRALKMLLNSCCALELMRMDEGKYSLTDIAQTFLVADSIYDLRNAIKYNIDMYQNWGKLVEFVRTGEPVEKPELHLGEDEERTKRFVYAMHHRALGIGRAVVSMLNLSGCRTLLDIGGGPGTYAILICKANPHIKCFVLDLLGIVKVAKDIVKSEGMEGSINFIEGDYHKIQFPAGIDVITFFGVLHQEAEESCKLLLKKAYNALCDNGRVYIMDVMTDKTGISPLFSVLFGINMGLSVKNGWVFSSEDLKFWLEEAGFKNFECKPLPPPMPHWLATAIKR